MISQDNLKFHSLALEEANRYLKLVISIKSFENHNLFTYFSGSYNFSYLNYNDQLYFNTI